MSSMSKVSSTTAFLASGLFATMSLQGCGDEDYVACADNQDCETGKCDLESVLPFYQDEYYSIFSTADWDNLTPGRCNGDEIVQSCRENLDCNKNYRCRPSLTEGEDGTCVSKDDDSCEIDANCNNNSKDYSTYTQFCDRFETNAVCKELRACPNDFATDCANTRYNSVECVNSKCAIAEENICFTSADCNSADAAVAGYTHFCDTSTLTCAPLPTCTSGTAASDCAADFLSAQCSSNDKCDLPTCSSHADCNAGIAQAADYTSICDGSGVCTQPKSCFVDDDCALFGGKCSSDSVCVIGEVCTDNSSCNEGNSDASTFTSFCFTNSLNLKKCTEEVACTSGNDCDTNASFLSGSCNTEDQKCYINTCTAAADCNLTGAAVADYTMFCNGDSVCQPLVLEECTTDADCEGLAYATASSGACIGDEGEKTCALDAPEPPAGSESQAQAASSDRLG